MPGWFRLKWVRANRRIALGLAPKPEKQTRGGSLYHVRQELLAFLAAGGLSGHPKAANDGHPKTGQ